MAFNFDKITDRIFVGSAPAVESDVMEMRDAGITTVLNLQTDEDFATHGIDWPGLTAAYQKHAIALSRVPMVDFDKQDLVARLPEATEVLDGLINKGETVYVHCTAGKERSPGTVACYLAWQRGMGLTDALTLVKTARDCQPFEDALAIADARYHEPG